MEYYLFVSVEKSPEETADNVFYRVTDHELASSLLNLFTREYSENHEIKFWATPSTKFDLEQKVLMKETLDWLAQYQEPDPGVYDPIPSSSILDRAQYAIRAGKWEELLRAEITTEAASIDDIPFPTTNQSEALPHISEEDKRNSGLNLLMMLAQAYYRMLELTISLAPFVTRLDLQLNESYFWLVRNIEKLLANHGALKDFPVPFEPYFEDLYPSTIADMEWDHVRPDVERFLSQVHRYVSAKGAYEPQKGSDAWVFVELFRPSVSAAIERAEEYNRQIRAYWDRILGGSSSTTTSDEIKDERIVKTVVELDLVGYSSISTHIEEGLNVLSVADLNEQIITFIEAGLDEANVLSEQALVMRTGDGAILVFDSANQAFQFAEDVHKRTQEHNSSRRLSIGKRVFRIGMATGEIVMRRKPEGGFDVAGSTIARAVRLEAKAQPGGVLIDAATFNSLRDDLKTRFGPKQSVQGKRDEKFEAYAAQINADGIKDTADVRPSSEKDEHRTSTRFGLDKRREVLRYLGKLKNSQLPELIFLLEMPIGQRPPEVLSLDQRKSEVLRWVEEEGKLTELLDILVEVDERSRS